MKYEFIKVAEPMVGEEEIAAVREVLLGGNYVSGAKVNCFEELFAQYIGVKHAVAVNSGTAALHIALEALGVKKGDEVIVPPLTFFATISSVLYVGATPVFADIDLDDLCLSPASVEKSITSKTKAIIPVHLFGATAKMNEIIALSENYNIPVLEDCAQAHGSAYNGQKAGGIGNAGAFSFFATKHMTTGEGGIITTNDSQVSEFCKIIRNHGMINRDDHMYLGFNNRMTEIQAAMGIVQLNKLDNLNDRRIANSNLLIRYLKSLPWAHVPIPTQNVKHTFFWCPLIVKKSYHKSVNDLKDHLISNRIEFRQRYEEPLYKQPVLKRLGFDYSRVKLKNSEQVAGKIIGLPNHPGLKKNELDRLITVLGDF